MGRFWFPISSAAARKIFIAVLLLLIIAWDFVLSLARTTSSVALGLLALVSLIVPGILLFHGTETPTGGLSLTSSKIIHGGIVTAFTGVVLSVVLSDYGIITSIGFAILGAAIFALLAIVAVAVVVKEKGWQEIFPE